MIDRSFLSTEITFRGGGKDSYEPANYSLVSANQRILRESLEKKSWRMTEVFKSNWNLKSIVTPKTLVSSLMQNLM